MTNEDIFKAADTYAGGITTGFFFDHSSLAAFARWAADQEKLRIIKLLRQMQEDVDVSGGRHNYYSHVIHKINGDL